MDRKNIINAVIASSLLLSQSISAKELQSICQILENQKDKEHISQLTERTLDMAIKHDFLANKCNIPGLKKTAEMYSSISLSMSLISKACESNLDDLADTYGQYAKKEEKEFQNILTHGIRMEDIIIEPEHMDHDLEDLYEYTMFNRTNVYMLKTEHLTCDMIQKL